MKYFWGILAVILVGIVAIVLLVGNTQPSKPSGKAGDLTNFDNDSSSVRLTIDGPENGVDEHRAIQITVDHSTRQFAILTGYQGKIASQQVFDNQDEAYFCFEWTVKEGWQKLVDEWENLKEVEIDYIENERDFKVYRKVVSLWSQEGEIIV